MAKPNSPRLTDQAQATRSAAQLKRRFIRTYTDAPPHMRRVIAVAVVLIHYGVPAPVVETVAGELADMWQPTPPLPPTRGKLKRGPHMAREIGDLMRDDTPEDRR